MECDAVDRMNSCWTVWFLKMEREGGPETSVTNYQPTPRNKLKQRRPEFKGLAQRINWERDKTSGSVVHSTGNFATRWPCGRFFRSSSLYGSGRLSASNNVEIHKILRLNKHESVHYYAQGRSGYFVSCLTSPAK